MDGVSGGPRTAAAGPPPLRLHTKLLYGLGSAAYGVKDATFRTFLLLYYNQVVGVPADLVSAAILVALVFDALSDPIVGQWSDSLQTRWGRRHPFIYASAIPAALAFILLFFPPDGLSDMMMFVYILCVSVAVRTLITFYEIPSSSLAPELAQDYDDRTRLASFRYFFGVTGGLGMAFAGLFIFLAPTPEYPVGQLNPDGYRAFAFTGAVVMASTILLSALGTHHRIPWLIKGTAAPWGGLRGHLAHMKAAYAHRGFHAILGFGLFKFTMLGLVSALALYFGTFYWRLGSRELAILALDGILSAFVAIWLAPHISRRWGKRNGAVGLSVAVVIFSALPFVLSFNGLFAPIGSPWLVPALFTTQFFYSLAGTTSMILVHAMIADVVEEQELATGRRSEGLFYSAHSFLQQCVSGLGVFLAGLMITAVGLPERADPAKVDPAIPANLVLLYLPVFAIGTLVAAFILRFYRIDRKSHEATLARLAAQKAPTAAE